MSDDLVKRLRAIATPGMEDWDDAAILEAAAAIIAKDAEIARLLEALHLAVDVAESWIHDQLDGTGSLGNALDELDPARAALNTQHKEGTP